MVCYKEFLFRRVDITHRKTVKGEAWGDLKEVFSLHIPDSGLLPGKGCPNSKTSDH